ncbi:uncharacterized protein E0L32_000748 [Thyridium curvatum]|uniref:NADP-dependent oxidoreductase domain-containing protein n=1 Tax=Thyridium curvatum TaxID=1093900 RepID=A0A507B6B5_9PEZI|nr:uncharacterized protein E0L32_000748 [Thyridium curvatum]TPX12571.1 hypothetical protein E0L32_000748 [Thyridium curvatum]
MASQNIPLRSLGKNGPKVPAMGFGLMPLSYAYGTVPPDEERFQLLDRALELGCTFWDTADLYGDSEELLGRWFKRTGNRDKIFLASKFGFVKGEPGYAVESSAEYCKKACEESLRLLGTDHIDLYYLHHPNPRVPIEQTIRAMAELKAQGKIHYIGLSNCGVATIRRAHAITPISVVQTEYSAFHRIIEGPEGHNTLKVCRELGISVVCYSPLGRGMLTSTFASLAAPGEDDPKDMRTKSLPRFLGEAKDHNAKIVAKFSELAAKHNCTASQLAIAWLLKQGDDIIPIPGTRKIKWLEQNWAALQIQLSDEDEKEIRYFIETSDIKGKHLPEAFDADLAFVETVEES